MTSPTETQRRTVLTRVLTVIDRKFMGANPDIVALREQHEPAVVRAQTNGEFEDATSRMLRDLGASHVGFFHEATPRTAGQLRSRRRS